MLVKNQNIELKIEGCTAEGNGVGHYEGMAVFVSGTAVGDTVTAHIIKVKKTYAVGIVKEIITPSEDRAPVNCDIFKSCGGCALRHISYEAEKRIKTQRVKDAFSRLAHMDILVREIVTGNTERYRNKAQYPVGDGKVGFYAQKSHRIIDCSDCLLQPSEFAEIVEIVKTWMKEFNISAYDSETNKGLIRHIYIRKGFNTGEIMVCLVANGETLPNADELSEAVFKIDGVKSLVLNINREKTNVILGKRCVTLKGSDYIEDVLCGVRIRISPLSFYQVNHDTAELLYGKAKEYARLTGGEIVLDLYCGAGTIGLSMARDARKIIGVEIVPEAVRDAKTNARINGIENCEFHEGDAKKAVKMLRDRKISPDVVILDPPRKGCDREVLECVAEMNPERIVYVSCDVSTQARDCAIFKDLGYETLEVTPVDMFPRTVHVETTAILKKI